MGLWTNKQWIFFEVFGKNEKKVIDEERRRVNRVGIFGMADEL